MAILTPLQTWKKNKSRLDLRKYSKDFQKIFSEKEEMSSSPGHVYAFRYVSENLPTDKHHVTPLVISFGLFRDEEGSHYLRGMNLFYVSSQECLEIVENFHKIKVAKKELFEPFILEYHSHLMKRFPYAFKNFKVSRIVSCGAVNEEDWGMIPLLRKDLFGNFNSSALNEDFKKEQLLSKKKKKKIVKKKEALSNPNVEESEQDISGGEFIEQEMISPSNLFDE